eukprot:TRINITY_DN106098_c0_g1_i1.p4 TRINITY_DN106098_c0_g1~~TRINITY_DN106098_c0_g1_i1.p4  ORF type:complete len:253 (+),score=9.19 TRINITY_DN106098_c0_g1_i1:1032-1790(+)
MHQRLNFIPVTIACILSQYPIQYSSLIPLQLVTISSSNRIIIIVIHSKRAIRQYQEQSSQLQSKMKAIILLSLLFATTFAKPIEDIDIWDITLQVEEITRGTGYGFLVSMDLIEASKCFKEMNKLVDILKELKEIIENKNSDFKSIAKLVNDFAQWFSAEWYSCGALREFGPEFRKYIEKIREDVGGYIGKVIGGLFASFFKNLSETYWFIYHHAREEYFYAGKVLGTFIYERFFSIVKQRGIINLRLLELR